MKTALFWVAVGLLLIAGGSLAIGYKVSSLVEEPPMPILMDGQQTDEVIRQNIFASHARWWKRFFTGVDDFDTKQTP